MVTNAGRVKVLGFGIARHTPLPTDATRVPTLAGTLGPTGQAIGTPGYMAPEQVAGQPADPASDVFALGAVLHYMLTGTSAFAGDSVWAITDATMRGEPQALISSGRPIARSALMMCDGDNRQRVRADSVVDGEGKALKQDPPSAGFRRRVAVWTLAQPLNRGREYVEECRCRKEATLLVPRLIVLHLAKPQTGGTQRSFSRPRSR